jgi:hypothetical protein
MSSVLSKLPTRETALEHDRLEHGTPAIHPGAHPGWTGSDDDYVVVVSRWHVLSSKVGERISALRLIRI